MILRMIHRIVIKVSITTSIAICTYSSVLYVLCINTLWVYPYYSAIHTRGMYCDVFGG